MSTPKDFDRLDGRPGRQGKDRFEGFKATTAADIEYRETYYATPEAQRAGLPDPDKATAAEAAEALARLKAGVGPIRADPKVDIKG